MVKELSTKELTEIARSIGGLSDIKQNLIEDSSNLKKYIADLKIQAGDIEVPNFIIYNHYVENWQPHGKKLSKVEFFRKFNKLFEQKRKTSIRYYLLCDGIFDVSKDAIREGKEKDKTRENKKSSTTRKSKSKTS